MTCAPLEHIKPMHIRAYLDKRSAKVRGNREIALFSTIWNMAREWGYTDKENPCRNVTRNKEQARTKYIEDDEYDHERYFAILEAIVAKIEKLEGK